MLATRYTLWNNKTTEMKCMINFRRANVNQSARGSRSSSSFGFSRQELPQRIFHLHSVLSSESTSSLTVSIYFLIMPTTLPLSSASFSQYTHHLSSVHVQTTSSLIVPSIGTLFFNTRGGLSLPCVDVGYRHWSNDRHLCA